MVVSTMNVVKHSINIGKVNTLDLLCVATAEHFATFCYFGNNFLLVTSTQREHALEVGNKHFKGIFMTYIVHEYA